MTWDPYDYGALFRKPVHVYAKCWAVVAKWSVSYRPDPVSAASSGQVSPVPEPNQCQLVGKGAWILELCAAGVMNFVDEQLVAWSASGDEGDGVEIEAWLTHFFVDARQNSKYSP